MTRRELWAYIRHQRAKFYYLDVHLSTLRWKMSPDELSIFRDRVVELQEAVQRGVAYADYVYLRWRGWLFYSRRTLARIAWDLYGQLCALEMMFTDWARSGSAKRHHKTIQHMRRQIRKEIANSQRMKDWYVEGGKR